MLASRVLAHLKKEFPDVEIDEIEVTTQPLRVLRDGVTMIPTLVHEGQKLAMLMPSESKIRDFIAKARMK